MGGEMFYRQVRYVIGVILLATLAGCATKQSLPSVSSNIEGKGLLVARLYVLGMQSMESASINIDGKLMPSSLRDGYVVVALDPGEHTLNQIQAAGRLLSRGEVEETSPIRLVKGGGAPSYIYVPGGSYTIHYTTLAVDRSFKIEPGKVTNLGLIVYLPVLDDPGKKRAAVNNSREFNVVALDNSAEIREFLDVNYPDLMRSMKGGEVLLAPTKYLEQKNLGSLRRMIAFHESLGKNVLNSQDKTVVYGRAGTVAVLSKSPEGVPQSVNVLDTGTLADIVGAAQLSAKYVFLTSGAQLLSWDGKDIAQSPFPYRVHPVRLKSLGSNGLLVVDNKMRIMSYDGAGDRWDSYENSLVKNPRSDINVISGSYGAYVGLGNRGVPEAVYYVEKPGKSPMPIPIPVGGSRIAQNDLNFMVAREDGLFVVFDKPDYYFWSRKNHAWHLYSLPTGKCKPLKIESEIGKLSVECDGVMYQSNNNGGIWSVPKI